MRGWVVIFVFAAVHNVVAALTGRPMLSQVARRAARAHPVAVPAAGLLLWAHLMGYLGPFDPLYWLGVGIERLGGRRG